MQLIVMNPLVNVVRAFGAREETESHDYECRACGAAFDVQYYVCPCCSGFSVDPRLEAVADDRTIGG